MKGPSAILIFVCLSIPFALVAQKKFTFLDERDGQVYPAVRIGSQDWMSADLNFSTEGSLLAPANEEMRYDVGFYSWALACEVCPEGWRLPSEDDWMVFVEFLHNCGMADRAHGRYEAGRGDFVFGTYQDFSGVAYPLKATSYWPEGMKGSGDSHFQALPVAWISEEGEYASSRPEVFWWTSHREEGSEEAWARGLIESNPYLQRKSLKQGAALPVRCMRDADYSVTVENAFEEAPSQVNDTGDQEETPYMIVENMPALGPCVELQGSERHQCTQMEIIRFVSQNTVYPPLCMENDVEGTVFMYFVVNKEGKVSDAFVLRSIDPRLDAEALRVIRSLPDFDPGRQKGKAVAVQYTIPIKYKIKN